MPTVAEMYRGIYGPAPSAQSSQLSPEHQATGRLTPADVQSLYSGIYGPATNAPRSAAQLSPDVYAGIYGPANRSNEPGNFPAYGALAAAFPGSSQTRTQQVAAAPANGTGFGSGMVKQDNERLLPNGGLAPAGMPPSTRSVPTTRVAGVAMPRSRPQREPQLVASYSTVPQMPIAQSPLSAMFAPTPLPALARPNAVGTQLSVTPPRAPLEILVEGSNTIRPTAPRPAPAAQRPAPVPQRAPSVIDQLRAMGMSSSQAYNAAAAASRDFGNNGGGSHGNPFQDSRSSSGGGSGLSSI